MSKGYRTKRRNSASGSNEAKNMTTTETTPAAAPIHESKKVKPVTADGVKVETQKVDAKFGNTEGSINYPRCTALTPEGALAMATSQNLTKTVTDKDGNEVETPLTDDEKFLKYFNAGYDAAMRITARNELAVLIEGPEKQINAIASRIAKMKFGDDSEDSIKKVKALPEFNSLVAIMG